MNINKIVRPEDNITVRKGTLKSVIDNIGFLNEILLSADSEFRTEQINQAITIITELSPSLKAVKFFEFFTVDEWLSNENNHGRIFVALIYLNSYFNIIYQNQLAKHKIIERLEYIRDNSTVIEIKSKIEEILAK